MYFITSFFITIKLLNYYFEKHRKFEKCIPNIVKLTKKKKPQNVLTYLKIVTLNK